MLNPSEFLVRTILSFSRLCILSPEVLYIGLDPHTTKPSRLGLWTRLRSLALHTVLHTAAMQFSRRSRAATDHRACRLGDGVIYRNTFGRENIAPACIATDHPLRCVPSPLSTQSFRISRVDDDMGWGVPGTRT